MRRPQCSPACRNSRRSASRSNLVRIAALEPSYDGMRFATTEPRVLCALAISLSPIFQKSNRPLNVIHSSVLAHKRSFARRRPFSPRIPLDLYQDYRFWVIFTLTANAPALPLYRRHNARAKRFHRARSFAEVSPLKYLLSLLWGTQLVWKVSGNFTPCSAAHCLHAVGAPTFIACSPLTPPTQLLPVRRYATALAHHVQ